jgi:tetratricopeptide (TPR) repeat protein
LARLQYHTSIALADLAPLTPMPEHRTLCEQAVDARRAALRRLNRTEAPAEWAWITVELGHALLPLAWTEQGAARTRLLAEAVEAYRAVLAVNPRHQQPEGWLQLQGFLAPALRYYAWGAPGPQATAARREAADIYRQMMEVTPRATRPFEWGTTQSNLGMLLCDWAEAVHEAERIRLLEESLGAQRAALAVFPREQYPMPWAGAGHALAYALAVQARDATSAPDRRARWDAAIAAYREVLEVVTPQVDAQRYQRIAGELAAAEAARGG